MIPMVSRTLPFLLVLLTGVSGYTQTSARNFWSLVDSEQLIPSLVQSMTDEELAGQVLLFTYAGEAPSPQFLELARKWNLGGIKIFGWNANSLPPLVNSIASLQALSQRTRLKIPLIVATDQEGGWVRHIRIATSQTPGNLALGASGYPYDAAMTGYYIGEELRDMGINMNFAPTVDIYSDLDNSVIGPRSFSADPKQTAVLAMAFYKGLEKAGVMATAKHFPGHGHTADDSHGKLPLVDVDMETLKKRELIPYDYLIRDKIPAIMSGHLAFPKITGNQVPASQSEFFLTQVIRGEMGFKNILITDDLFMEGARLPGKRLDASAEASLRAGNDMIMMSQPLEDQIATWDRFVRLSRTEPAFRKRLQEAAGRILAMKMRYIKPESRVPLYPTVAQASRHPTREARDFFFQQAARSVSIIKARRIPLEDPNPLVVTVYPRFFEAVKARFPGATALYLDWDPFFSFSQPQAQRLRELLPRASSVIFNLVTPGNAELLKTLQPWASKITVASLLTPAHLHRLPWVDSALAAYGTNPDSMEVLAAALAGDFVPPGKVPLDLGAP